MCFFLSFKFQINVLWGVAISIQIHTHELKGRQLFIQNFASNPSPRVLAQRIKDFRKIPSTRQIKLQIFNIQGTHTVCIFLRNEQTVI